MQLGDCDCCWLAWLNFIKHNGLLLANYRTETGEEKEEEKQLQCGQNMLKINCKTLRENIFISDGNSFKSFHITPSQSNINFHKRRRALR